MNMSIMDTCSSTHGRILIIEDETDIRDILRLQLENAGYQVIEAKDGQEGIELMKKGSNLLQVGLIITDIRMPKVNGVEAIDYIKANAPSIPIMVITGYPDTELAINLLQKGVKDYLVKPVEKDTLLSKVSTILSSKQDFNYV
jgi:CheY-like chemotaxis protein